MILSHFLTHLVEEGHAYVENDIQPFDPADVQNAADFLAKVYQNDRLDMPDRPPQYLAAAAVWAAQFLYRAVQCTVLRNLEADVVKELLKPYPEPPTPEAIYCVDLTFRHLPDVFKFAKGLAPDDILVTILRENAVYWPFSSVGMAVEVDIAHENVLAHPSLRIAYIDRIIEAKDIKRVNSDALRELVETALGDYTPQLWADFGLKK
jgi:MoxR-vWA-beta-propeller ternary system domain bpX4